MLESFINNTMAGINNPECAFFVGNMAGSIGLGYLMFRIALIYYGFKILDKLTFIGIPKLYNWVKLEIKYRKYAR